MVVTSGFLMLAGTLATLSYLYLVAIFLAGRWARDTLLPHKREEDAGESAAAAYEQLPQLPPQQQRAATSNEIFAIKERNRQGRERHRDPAGGKISGELATDNSSESERMRRDIAKSLQ